MLLLWLNRFGLEIPLTSTRVALFILIIFCTSRLYAESSIIVPGFFDKPYSRALIRVEENNQIQFKSCQNAGEASEAAFTSAIKSGQAVCRSLGRPLDRENTQALVNLASRFDLALRSSVRVPTVIGPSIAAPIFAASTSKPIYLMLELIWPVHGFPEGVRNALFSYGLTTVAIFLIIRSAMRGYYYGIAAPVSLKDLNPANLNLRPRRIPSHRFDWIEAVLEQSLE